MKTKLIQRASNLVAILAFLAIFAGKAFAVDNDSRVVSPYWQSDSGSYTFIAVTHTSLSGMASQIGVTINAIQNDETTFGSAVSFTIQGGSTQRVFITRSGHSTINPTTIPTATFIQGTTDFKHGHIRIDPVSSHPNFSVTGNKYGKFSRCTDVSNCQSSLNNVRNGGGFRDATMLSYWGAVVIEQNTTGFAMEFIGDMQDSSPASGAIDHPQCLSCTYPTFDVGVPHPGPAAP
tara:strand:- start:54 stop:755 length:702 start_codon:yes stop_codon:yes gene_type:complete